MVAEGDLAHRLPNKIEGAYVRIDLLDRCRKLMDAWADYVVHRGE